MDYLAVWSKNPAAYIQKGYCNQDSTTRTEKASSDDDNIEVGFVDGLFEMYKIKWRNKKSNIRDYFRISHLILLP